MQHYARKQVWEFALSLFALSLLLLFQSCCSFLRVACSFWSENFKFVFFTLFSSPFYAKDKSESLSSLFTKRAMRAIHSPCFFLYKKREKSNSLFYVKKTSNLHDKPKSKFPSQTGRGDRLKDDGIILHGHGQDARFF